MTVKEVAQYLGLSDQTVRDYIKNGRFPGSRRKTVNPMSPYMVPESAVRAFERSRMID